MRLFVVKSRIGSNTEPHTDLPLTWCSDVGHFAREIRYALTIELDVTIVSQGLLASFSSDLLDQRLIQLYLFRQSNR